MKPEYVSAGLDFEPNKFGTDEQPNRKTTKASHRPALRRRASRSMMSKLTRQRKGGTDWPRKSIRRQSDGSTRAARRQERHTPATPPIRSSTVSSLWRTHESASSGRSAQSCSGGGHGIRLNTETWTVVVCGFLDRLRLRAVAAGGGAGCDGIADRSRCGRTLVRPRSCFICSKLCIGAAL